MNSAVLTANLRGPVRRLGQKRARDTHPDDAKHLTAFHKGFITQQCVKFVRCLSELLFKTFLSALLSAFRSGADVVSFRNGRQPKETFRHDEPLTDYW